MVTWDRIPPKPEKHLFNSAARCAGCVEGSGNAGTFEQSEALTLHREAERDTTVSLTVSINLHTWIACRLQGTAASLPSNNGVSD
jgi:hypothetical protein